MIEIDVKEAITKPKGTRVRLRPISHSYASYLDYKGSLNKILFAMFKEVRKNVIPSYTSYNKLKQDSESWLDGLKELIAQLLIANNSVFLNVASKENIRHRKRFISSAKKSLGIDLSQVVRDDDISDVLSDYNSINNSLIKSLTGDVLKEVEQMVYNAKIQGLTSRELKENISKKFSVSKNRAELIARDQLNKLNADFNEIRQKQIGVEKYEWHTSEDERVRSRHAALNGKVYEIGEPTEAEQGLPPGKPIRCRCISIAIIEF